MHDKDTARGEFGFVVLAGGRSRRMGRDKAWLELGGEALLARVCRTLVRLGPVWVAAGAPGRALPAISPDVELVFDAEPDQGPLAGLLAAHAAMPASIDRVFACGCDLPLVDARLPAVLDGLRGAHACALPVLGGRRQKLAGVYARRCFERAAQAFARGARAVTELADAGDCVTVDAALLTHHGFDPITLSNINTESDLDAARAWLAANPDS